MPITTAKLRHLHIAPRKVRLVADIVRGKTAQEALVILNFTTKKAAYPISKLLNSALANAKNNFQLDSANLYISKITVDEGPKIKRWRARARGSAYEIQKKTSHINIVLEEIIKSKNVKKARKAKKETAAAELGPLTPGVGGETPGAEATPVKKQGRPKPIIDVKKPAEVRGIKRIFRRKAF